MKTSVESFFCENECRKLGVPCPELGEADANWIFLVGHDYSQIRTMKSSFQRLMARGIHFFKRNEIEVATCKFM